MDIKNKLKNFLSKENASFSVPNVDVDEATNATSSFIQKADLREFDDDPTPDIEVIDAIEEIYFSEVDEFDSSQYELDKLPEVLCKDELDKSRNVLRRQHLAVSRELSKKILENQGAYVRELTRVMDLERSLQNATNTCIGGRMNLSKAEREIAFGGLQVLAKNRRKVLLEGILKSLRFIKTLQETDIRLKELLEESSYASAIQICLEYRKAAVSFNQYTCISELSNNLLDILEHIKELLDVALSKLCITFNEEEYSQIQEAYKLLGNTQIAMDSLQMHFVNTVNKEAVKTLYEVLEDNNIRTTDTNFSSLCNAVPLEEFTPCLVKLCKTFWKIMYSYHEAMKWHLERENLKEGEKDDCEKEIGFIYDTKLIKSKLEQGLVNIWQDIQMKIQGYVLSSNFAYFKYDDLIKVLDIINQLISIGEKFCKKKSKVLQESIRTQTVNYFKAYHKSNIDELRMFLENEAWELCPVKKNFSFLDLKEFHFMKSHISTKSGSDHSLLNAGSADGYFDNDRFNKVTTPFDLMDEDKPCDKIDGEEVFSYYDDDDDDEDVPDELKQDYVDENTGEEQPENVMKPRKRSALINGDSPIVANTTLNVLRSFGKYMQMITVLKPIAFDVVTFLTQLFDYYLYSVFTFFSGKSGGPQVDWQKDSKLKDCLSRIYNSIILKQDIDSEDSLKVSAPSLSTLVDLENPQTLYGFVHKLIGVESLVFLSTQLRMVYHSLDSWIPTDKQPFLAQFYSQTVDVVPEIRTPVFKTIADKVVEYDKILQMMSTVKWDVKDLMSDYSPYVTSLVQEYQRLDRIIIFLSSTVAIPSESLLEFWKNVVIRTNHVFVEGFSSAKKCSNHGRALMLLDFQTFLTKIEHITKLKPIPDRDYVVNYINAFYLSESTLEQWLKEHQEYSPKQLRNLVSCGTGSHIGKKMKEKLSGLLNELESNNLMTK